jgi:peptidoglycan/LPS O-acetylase OafA/YrhL
MRATTKPANGIVPALTSIRFLAALTVVLSHYRELDLLNVPASFFTFVDGGRSAVSLFFVLSGFILTYTYREELANGSAHDFYVARVARIYPNVLFALAIASVATAWVLITHNDALLLSWFALKNSINLSLAVSFVCQVLLITAWFPFASIHSPWNGPASSVSCEAFFYALFPLILRRLLKMRGSTIAVTLGAIWIAQGLMIAFFFHALPVSRSHFLAEGLPLCRIAEFIMGIGAALAFQAWRSSGRSTHLIGIALVSISVVVLIVIALWQPLEPVFYPQGPFFASLILGLALLERPVLGLLNQRWLVRFGEASYALFLTHVPIAYLAWLLGFRANNGWIPLTVTLLFSIVMFTYFEEPMRRRIRRRFRRPALAQAPVVPDATPVEPAVTVGRGVLPN